MPWNELAQTYANLGCHGMSGEGRGHKIARITDIARDRKSKNLTTEAPGDAENRQESLSHWRGAAQPTGMTWDGMA
jgi:hypothetical protein